MTIKHEVLHESNYISALRLNAAHTSDSLGTVMSGLSYSHAEVVVVNGPIASQCYAEP